jgi:deoxyribodipyrimidine photo-lyase
MIELERIKNLNTNNIKNGNYVIYWMQASQREAQNHALEFSITNANKLNKPLLVYFGITDKYPEANQRHYHFMLEGLKEVQSSLEKRGIQTLIQHISPEKGVTELAKTASLVVVDRGYTKIEQIWRKFVANNVTCPLIQVESNVVIPVEIASPKEEYSAATFRPKIKKHINHYLKPLERVNPKRSIAQLKFSSFNIKDTNAAISKLNISRNVKSSQQFIGGTSQAKKHLRDFIEYKLDNYSDHRNNPTKHVLSNMSPYLHFGQISPVYIALQILETNNPNIDVFLDELIVRRELAFNFIFYNKSYDSLRGLPEWAKNTLDEHQKDPREYIYSVSQMENAQTHDPYWNAAQKEMIITGKMHGYMRMYWGKKIIEWTKTPKEAYRIAIYLNNKYELDGRDPNAFTGIAWCFGKHDRPWKERSIFGKIRYMNANGLKRKFDADKYIHQINQL